MPILNARPFPALIVTRIHSHTRASDQTHSHTRVDIPAQIHSRISTARSGITSLVMLVQCPMSGPVTRHPHSSIERPHPIEGMLTSQSTMSMPIRTKRWFAPRCLAQRWGWPSLHRGLPPDVWPGGGRGLHCTLACPPHVFPVTCYGPMDWALEAQRARRRSSGYRDGPRGQDGPWWPQGGRTGPQAARRRPHKEPQVS